MQIYAVFPSPLGPLTLTGDGTCLTGLWLPQQHVAVPTDRDDAAFPAARQWLERYFAGDAPPVEPVAMAPGGTPFQAEVWALLRRIPYGQSVTYGALARQLSQQLGHTVSARAVGGAVGRNPISILVPCHRVLGAGGALTGYAGGLAAKRWLLRHEGISFSDT